VLAFGLSGGIASGKSTACRILARVCPGAVIFEADACVHRLFQADPGVIAAVRTRFGDGVIGASGGVERDALRQMVFGNTAARRDLEAMVHPRVREECLESLASARRLPASLFVADIPLLFENGFDFGQGGNLLVAAGLETRCQRLRDRNGFDDATIASILAAQMPQEEKLRRADHVLWNEGPPSVLEAQWLRFLHSHAIP
jgi:dephospho-CoA kinase